MQQVALNLPNIWPKIASFYQKLLSNFDLLFGSLKRPKVVEMQQSCMLWQPWLKQIRNQNAVSQIKYINVVLHRKNKKFDKYQF